MTSIFMQVGGSTAKLARLKPGDTIPTFVGPLGRETVIENVGTVLCVGGCYGIGSIYPIARALKEAGNKVYTLIEARSSFLLYWEDKLAAVSDKVFVITRDGTKGQKGHIDKLPELMQRAGITPQLVIVNGCTFQMMRVSDGHEASGLEDDRQHEPDHDRRHGHVRRLPPVGRRKDEVRLRRRPRFRRPRDRLGGVPGRGARATIRRKSTRSAGAAASPISDPDARESEGACSEVAEEKQEKKKLDLNRRPMPKQDPWERVKNFDEVALGYPTETAVEEASRCLQCKKPLCNQGCPVGHRHSRLHQACIVERRFRLRQSRRSRRPTRCRPSAAGSAPRKSSARRRASWARRSAPIAIGRLERFLADWEAAEGKIEVPKMAPKTGKKVAIIGAGPAGITVANDLVIRGHDVTIFEALHECGGVLIYGIPEFRLPKAIVHREVEYVRSLGVKIYTDFVVGKTRTVDKLLEEFDALFVGSGAGLPWFMEIPGENLNGVYSANEYLTRVNLMKGFRFPEYQTPVKTAVSGGRRRRRERGHGFGPDGPSTGRGRGAPRLPPQQGGAARPGRGGGERRGGRGHLRPPHAARSPHRRRERLGQGDRVPEDGARRAGRLGPAQAGSRRGVQFPRALRCRRHRHRQQPQSAHPDDDAGAGDQQEGRHRDQRRKRPGLPGRTSGPAGTSSAGAATVISAMGDGRIAAASMHKYLMESEECNHDTCAKSRIFSSAKS